MKGFIKKMDMFMSCVRASARIHTQLRTLGYILTRTVRVDGQVVHISNDIAVTNGIMPWEFNVMVLQNGSIITNDEFEKAPHSVQEAIIAHEIGHIKAGHLKETKYKLWFLALMRSFGGDVSYREIEADKYAADQGKDMIGAIEYMMSHRYRSSAAMNEFKIRIEALKVHLQRKQILAEADCS